MPKFRLEAPERTGAVGGNTHIFIDDYVPGDFVLSVKSNPGGLQSRTIIVSHRQAKGIEIVLLGRTLHHDFVFEIFGTKAKQWRFVKGQQYGFTVEVTEEGGVRRFTISR